MNILLIGRGWTGQKMLKQLVDRGHSVSIASHKNYESLLNFGEYEWVVNCAGVTGFPNVDSCELDKANTIEGNTAFPIILYEKLKTRNIKLAHFSSGCIYTGEIHDVNADPNFFGSTYSISKGISDMYLKDKALVFRIRMPFTSVNERKNYLTKVYNYSKNGKLIDYGQNSLTDLDEALKVAAELIEEGAMGPYNLVNSGTVNMHEVAEIMQITPEWFTPEEFRASTAAGRSTCVVPDCGRMRPIREALADAVSKMKLT